MNRSLWPWRGKRGADAAYQPHQVKMLDAPSTAALRENAAAMVWKLSSCTSAMILVRFCSPL